MHSTDSGEVSSSRKKDAKLQIQLRSFFLNPSCMRLLGGWDKDDEHAYELNIVQFVQMRHVDNGNELSGKRGVTTTEKKNHAIVINSIILVVSQEFFFCF